MFFDLTNQSVRELMTEAEFGIERESLRVNADGTLAQSEHPFGARRHIDRDFCENQVEIIGDVFNTPEDLNRQLHAIQNEIGETLAAKGELLWPFSNPPKISGEDEIPVARFVGSQQGKSAYRHYLAAKYGKKKMLFSGIHLNFSFTEPLLQTAFSQSGQTGYAAFKNGIYLSLAKRLTQYAWLVVFLTAASPVTDASLGIESNVYASPRCSVQGYWNDFIPILDYKDLNSYVDSVERYVESGRLKSASELYYPVRVKTRGANSLDALRLGGINHLELRVLDVNPLSRTGIFTEDIRFIHLLLLYLSNLPEFDFDAQEQERAVRSVQAAAVFGNEQARQAAAAELEKLSSFAECCFPAFADAVRYQQNKLKKGGSYAEIISAQYTGGYMNKGLALARVYQRGVTYV